MDYDTSSLANGVSAGLDQISKTYQNGKIADSIVRVNPEMLDMIGMPKEQFSSLSASDKTSAITGMITALGIKQKQAQVQQEQTQSAQNSAALTESQREASGTVNFNNYLSSLMNRPRPAAPPVQLAPPQTSPGAGPTAPAGFSFPGMQPPITPAMIAGIGGVSPAGAPAPSPGALRQVMGAEAIGPQEILDAATRSGMLGTKRVDDVMNSFARYNPARFAGKTGKGMPVGQQTRLADGTVITGMGEQNEPNIRPPKAAEGMKVGESFTDAKGNQWFGKGEGISPELKLAPDSRSDILALNASNAGIDKLDAEIEALTTKLQRAASSPETSGPPNSSDITALADRKLRRDALKKTMMKIGSGGSETTQSPPPQTNGMVKVRHPNGRVGSIPANQLSTALSQGFTRVQ